MRHYLQQAGKQHQNVTKNSIIRNLMSKFIKVIGSWNLVFFALEATYMQSL